MLYPEDFTYNKKQSKESKVQIKNKIFTVILDNYTKLEKSLDRYSIINSTKPLSYFTCLFGAQIVRYEKNEVKKVKLHSKIYSLLVIAFMSLVYFFVTPNSWKDTKSDVPLNTLTKIFGYLSSTEVKYLIFISTIGNSDNYLELLEKLDEFDQHFSSSKRLFIKRKIVAISLIVFSILEVSCTFCLKQFNIHNIGVYFTLYLLILQRIVIVYFLGNVYSRLLVFNDLLLHKALKVLPSRKAYIFKDSLGRKLNKKLFTDSHIIAQKLDSHYSLFELMQMYDKTADCVYLFNKIYAGQVFFMFQTGLVCTVLTICRYLSPSLKNSEVMLSDIYVYTCINIRPLYVSKLGDLMSDERNKILAVLMHLQVHADMGDAYHDQIKTMINLVGARKMEISANVFTADLQTAMNFSGRVISYTVLMIQYFYMHVFSE